MTVSEQIIQVINDLCTKFGMAIDWTSENIYPYVQELVSKYIKFEIVTSGALCVLCISLIIIGSILVKKAIVAGVLEDVFCEDIAIVEILVGGIFLIIGIAVIIFQVEDIITCLIFPEKQVFDYVTKLIKENPNLF